MSDGRKFLNLSGGMLALVIALVILMPILCCAGLSMVGAVSGQ